MAEILLIQPYLGEMDVIRDKPHLPLSLIQAATLVSQEYNIKILDLRLISDYRPIIRKELSSNPLFVGFSVMSGRPVARALEVSKYIKQISDVPVLWGGHHPTLDQENVIANPNVDMIVIGDGEKVVRELADRLSSNKSLDGLKGVWFKKDNEIVRNHPAPPVKFDELPFPPYHLVNVENYIQVYRGKRMLNIETSRGCNFSCRYCYHSADNSYHKFRSYSAERTLERIFWARDNFNVDGVYLVDDNFFLDTQRGRAIVAEMAAQKTSFLWQIQGIGVPSMLEFDVKSLEELEKSGLLRISVGAESGSPKILRYTRKPQTLEMILEANRLWSSTDINIWYNFLSGFPAETVSDVKMTIDLMFRLCRENSHARTSPIYNFLPYPGSPLWEEVVEKHHFKPPESLEEWGQYDWNHINVPYLSREMKGLLDNLYWPSLCVDSKFDDYKIPGWIRRLFQIYQPIGRMRLKTGFMSLPIEKYAAKIAERLLQNSKHRSYDTPFTL